jgi:putative ABC transport system substrate-binding protein
MIPDKEWWSRLLITAAPARCHRPNARTRKPRGLLDFPAVMRLIGLAVILAVGLTLAPLAATGQQTGKVWRIGVLSGSPPTTPEAARPWEALFQGLRELGYIEGQNLAVERRWADGRAERYHELAAEIVALKPDVIIAAFTPSVSAAKRATSTIPIVMAFAGDPVGTGLVASLARPGGNVTGMSLQNSPELAGKRLELLKEAFPSVSRVGLLVNRTLPHRDFIERDLQRTALAVGVKLQPFEVSGPEDFTGGLMAKASETFQALVVHPDPLAFSHRHEIAEFGMKKKMPVMAAYGFAEAGCLMSYDAYWPDLYRRAASYVDKILKGAKPADLPVEQPTKFELVINLKTAKALDLTIPQSLLLRADRIIE